MAKYTFKDFKSDQEIRWCPGCGDFSVVAALQKTLPVVCEEKGIDKDKIVVVAGIDKVNTIGGFAAYSFYKLCLGYIVKIASGAFNISTVYNIKFFVRLIK